MKSPKTEKIFIKIMYLITNLNLKYTKNSYNSIIKRQGHSQDLQMSAFHIRVPVQLPGALLPIQLLLNVPGEAAENSSRTWVLAIHGEAGAEFLAPGFSRP